MEPNLLSLLFGTVLLRPYVFIFMAVYLIASTLQFGLKRTVSFMVIGYCLVFLAEYSSTHTGFPSGCYNYLDTPAPQDAWLVDLVFVDARAVMFPVNPVICYTLAFVSSLRRFR